MLSPGRLLWLEAALLMALGLSACKSASPTPANVAGKLFMQAFLVRGVVREVKPAEKTIVIQHEEIPGYMPAMTMPFPVRNVRELGGVHPGDEVTFRMIVTSKTGWIERLHVVKAAPPATGVGAPASASPPAAPVRVVREVEPLKVGYPLPDYTFTNQFGQAVSLGQFHGQALAITFIFTRCPFPTFCPRMSGNFTEVQNNLKAMRGGPTNWHLLTLSFDPAYDTPATLLQYAGRYGYDPRRWSFLTGSLLDITALTEQAGLQFWRETPTEPITHNLRTVVVDARGRVQKILSNNDWTSAELTAEMIKAAAAK